MIELRTWQTEALTAVHNAWREQRRPVIQAVMGAGKSFVIAELARQAFHRGYHVTVTVPTQNLVNQLADTFEANTNQVAGRFYADCKEVYPVTFVCHPSLSAYEAARNKRIQQRELVARKATNGRVTEYRPPQRFWIADECHKTECDTVHDWLETVELKHRVGLTATPWRAEESESITAFDELVYTYSAQDAHRDGHIVKPTVHHADEGDPDTLAVNWIHQQTGGGVCNAVNISDAEDFVLTLQDAGLDAIAVHSQQPRFGAPEAKAHVASGGVVVYVDMLSEGFDCPAIKWMVMRRPVKSRVRFAQEVGRGLRAAPGKETCHVLDVYDLFNTHSLDWRACVGEIDQREVVPHLKLIDILKQGGESGASLKLWPEQRMPPEYLKPVRSFLRATRVAMQFDGRIDLTVESTHWRSDPVSRKQFNFLHRLMAEKSGAIDEEMRPAFAAAYYGLRDSVSRAADDLSGAMRKGDAADFISILKGL